MFQRNKTASKIIDILVIILAIMLLIALCFLFRKNSPTEHWLAFEKDNPIRENHKEIEEQNITIQGYGNLVVNDENPDIHLVNAAENDVYLVYTLAENGSVFYETAAIKPGNMVELNLCQLLERGRHTITMEIGSYDVATMAICNGTIQTLQVEVK